MVLGEQGNGKSEVFIKAGTLHSPNGSLERPNMAGKPWKTEAGDDRLTIMGFDQGSVIPKNAQKS